MLAGAAIAQQPDDQEQKNKKQHQEKAHNVQAKPRANANANVAKPQMNAVKQHGAPVNERAMPNAHNAHKAERTLKSEKALGAETNVSSEAATNAMPEAKQHAEHGRKGMKAAGVNAKTTANPAGANTAATISAASQQNAQVNAAGGGKKKLDPQKVQQIKQQHASFRAQPKPQQVPAVTFQQNYRIHGADGWQGRQYEVFRSYHSERHDRGWYHSHFNRVELIGGGYYYWNNGYWFPAWGYDSAEEYYAYDAPIYVGHAAEPPDRVIADVQATLQDMGYYKGEVDGLLGPLTREALASYQADQGLTQTEMIDEPTLDSLGMS
jgi:hypothetical protein